MPITSVLATPLLQECHGLFSCTTQRDSALSDVTGEDWRKPARGASIQHELLPFSSQWHQNKGLQAPAWYISASLYGTDFISAQLRGLVLRNQVCRVRQSAVLPQ